MARSSIAHRSLRFAAPWLIAFAVFEASAASKTPATATPADIDAVRGCWIQKVEPDGRATLLLRLLPDRERQDWLTGQLQRADGDDPDRRLRLMFARDGQSAALASRPITEPASAAAASPVKTLRSTKARKPTADMMATLVHNPSGQIEFKREPDNATASNAIPSKGAAPGTRVIEFSERGGGKRLRVEVSAEWLKLSVGAPGLPAKGVKRADTVLFDGGRDGCD